MNALQTAPQVTVIGAGIVGICCALALQKKGFQVRVVDKFAPGEATSFGNAGVLAECGCVPVNLPGFVKKVPQLMLDPQGPLSISAGYMHRIAPWGISFMLNSRRSKFEQVADAMSSLLKGATERHVALAAEHGASDWVCASPYYYLYRDETDFMADRTAWQAREQRGITYDILQGDGLAKAEPAIAEEYRYAVSLHGHGFSRNPEKLVKALAASFVEKGGELIQADIRDVIVEDNRPVGLLTHKGVLPVSKLVVAAGVWSRKLAARFDRDIPLQSERGYHIEVHNPGISLQQPIMYAAGKLVATPVENGIRFAGLVEFAELDSLPDRHFCHRLLYHARRLFPNICLDDFTEWMGNRPSMPDSLPVISRSDNFSDVFYAFGHQHMGLTLGPHTGELIADLVSGARPGVDLQPFSISRF